MSKLGLFPRILLAFLLVIAVASIMLFVIGFAVGPNLLEAHLESMGLQPDTTTPGVEAMLTDLRINYRKALTQSLLWAILVALIVGSAISVLLSSQIVTPLRRLRTASHAIAAGRYEQRLNYSGASEITALVNDFNQMATALEVTEHQRLYLMRSLGHELRTPLMNLRGYLEGIQDGVFDADSDTFAAVQRQVERLERLINDLSLLARVEAQQERIEPELVAAKDICERAMQAVLPLFLHAGINLSCDAVPAEHVIFADPLRVEQILNILLSNALRHTARGGNVRLWTTKAGTNTTFHVQDDGEGIATEALPHIFERFYRADTARSHAGGSGIGLTIAQHFVNAQQGQLYVESHPGQGSHFWFNLPSTQPSHIA
ncbi:MAG: ATP-binding protein [Deinococcota bacterium]